MSELYDLRNNFSYYHDFYISAKEKSYSEAGRKNNISGSSLTRSVKELENILNLKLIQTNNKGFELTIDGERLYKTLDKLFNTIDIFSSENLSKKLDVILTIGTTRNIADFVLSKFLTKFNKKYPNIKYKIYTDNASNLNDYLMNHKIDLLIDYLPQINYSEKYDLIVKPIEEYKTCFACSKEYYNIIKDKITSLKDLPNYTLVISGSSRRRQMLDEILQKNNINLEPKHLMPDSKLMADFIKDNNYIGYFIEDETETYDLKKINLKEEMPVNPIGLIYPKNTNHITKEFVETIIDKR